jgi:hypothetical protein
MVSAAVGTGRVISWIFLRSQGEQLGKIANNTPNIAGSRFGGSRLASSGLKFEAAI